MACHWIVVETEHWAVEQRDSAQKLPIRAVFYWTHKVINSEGSINSINFGNAISLIEPEQAKMAQINAHEWEA